MSKSSNPAEAVVQPDRSMRIVIGYHDVTAPPQLALANNLHQRVAFVLDSFRSDKEDMYFDAELYFELMLGVQRDIGAETAQGDLNGVLRSLSEIRSSLVSRVESDREPPNQLRFIQAQSIIAIAEAELWAHVGGPVPYADSYTVSVYSGIAEPSKLIAMAEETCRRLDATLVEVITAAPAPYRPSRFRRFLRSMGLSQ